MLLMEFCTIRGGNQCSLQDFDLCEFAQMINSLKFLPKDFTTLRTRFINFLHYIWFFYIQATVLH